MHLLKVHKNVRSHCFQNVAYLSSYLHLKTFAWNRDYVISQKLQSHIHEDQCRKLLQGSIRLIQFGGPKAGHIHSATHYREMEP